MSLTPVSTTKELSRDLKLRVRQLYHSGQLTRKEILDKAPNLTEQQLNEIISEQDDLEDFRLEKFNTQVRNLYELSQSVIDSITNEDLLEASLSAKATLLKNSNDIMRRIYELQMVQLQQSDDMALARLLSLGRDEARRQLTDRFRGLFHVLFAGQDPNEVAHQLGLMDLSKQSGGSKEPKKYALDDDDNDDSPDAEVIHGGVPKLSLVDSDQPDGTNEPGSGDPAQGVGAFRGVKKTKPS